MIHPDIRIEGFEILEIVGHGGMGTVYRARQEFFDREVALKVVQPQLASDSDFTARFRSEMKHAALIDHPNVVPVYAAGESNGLLYIAMKLIRGENLATRLKTAGPLPPEAAVELAAQVASALDEAHDEGFVHRDVKPANILLAEGSDQAYLTDFGIAKSLEASQSLTATGHGVGTIKYVAPEQIQGESLDRRADVYSLGCVLFEMLTGSLPFDEGSDAAILYAKVNDELRLPGEVDADLRSFDRALDRALSRDPADRFDSAGELAAGAWDALEGDEDSELETETLTGVDDTAVLPLPVPEAAPAKTLRPAPRPREPDPGIPSRRPPDAIPSRSKIAPARGPDRRLRIAAAGAVLVCTVLIVGLLIARSGDDTGDGKTAGNKSAATGKQAKQKEPAATASAEPEPEPEVEAEVPPADAETDAAPASTLATVAESRSLFETEVPEGWIPSQVDQSDSGRFTNTWISPEDERVSVLIDSQPTGEEDPSAIDSAASVRDQTSGSAGYAEIVFEETELNGLPAARWVFDVGSERKVDYFFYDCGIGVAVLGAAPRSDFATYEDVFADVAESTRPRCESTGTGSAEGGE